MPTDLSQFGLAPAGPSSPGGVGSDGSKTAPAQGSPEVPAIPGDALDSDAEMTVALGAFRFPTGPGQGKAVVEIDSGQGLDTQKASGNAKAKTKQTGVEPTTGTIELTWFRPFFASAAAPFIGGIDPNGISKGGPFEIRNPRAKRRNLAQVIVKHVGPEKWAPGGAMGSCTIQIEEWVPPPAVTGTGKGGGVKTPDAAQKWASGNEKIQAQQDAETQARLSKQAVDNGQLLLAQGGATAGAAKGLDGVNAPNADVPQ